MMIKLQRYKYKYIVLSTSISIFKFTHATQVITLSFQKTNTNHLMIDPDDGMDLWLKSSETKYTPTILLVHRTMHSGLLGRILFQNYSIVMKQNSPPTNQSGVQCR